MLTKLFDQKCVSWSPVAHSFHSLSTSKDAKRRTSCVANQQIQCLPNAGKAHDSSIHLLLHRCTSTWKIAVRYQNFQCIANTANLPAYGPEHMTTCDITMYSRFVECDLHKIWPIDLFAATCLAHLLDYSLTCSFDYMPARLLFGLLSADAAQASATNRCRTY
jgi:hypothetical protein